MTDLPDLPSASERRVLILGAGGRLGAAATAAFAQAGWQVLAQARRAPATLPPGAIHVGVDLSEVGKLARESAGAQVVIYAVNPACTEWRQLLLPLARLGLEVAERLDAVFMLPGNVYPFGRCMPPLLLEDTPWQPDTVKCRLRARLEQEVAERGQAGLRSVIIRSGDFFGAGRGSWLDLVILKSLATGRLVYPGPTDVAHAWAYLPDLARAFTRAAALAAAGGFEPGATTLHFAGHTLTGTQFLDAVERAVRRVGAGPAQRMLVRRGMPWTLIRAGGLFVPMWREIAELSFLWRAPHCLDGSRLQRRLGPQAQTPIDDALAASLRALGHGAAAPH